MKAKELYAKYKDDIMSSGDTVATPAVYDLLHELSTEASDMYKARNCNSSSAMISIFRELNTKWNAIVNLFEKEYGFSPLKRDGFLNFAVAKVPEIGTCIIMDNEQRSRRDWHYVNGEVQHRVTTPKPSANKAGTLNDDLKLIVNEPHATPPVEDEPVVAESIPEGPMTEPTAKRVTLLERIRALFSKKASVC